VEYAVIRSAAVFAVAIAIGCQAPALDESEFYDVWIHGGTIVDGTGGEPYAADLVIAGDTTVYVGNVDFDLHAATPMDATG
jgi:adenine deaminase